MSRRVALLVDGSNIHATCQRVGYQLDYKLFKQEYRIGRALYFTALPPASEQSTLRPMVDYLEFNGWTIVQKEWKELRNETTGVPEVKGNMDVEIAVRACELAPHIDMLYLASGDGDFTSLIESLQRLHGIYCVVVSAHDERKRIFMCADSLRRQADEFINLADDDVRNKLIRQRRDADEASQPRKFWNSR